MTETADRTDAFQFRSIALAANAHARGDNRHQIAKRDLTRYYRLLSDELAGLSLSPEHWRTLRDALSPPPEPLTADALTLRLDTMARNGGREITAAVVRRLAKLTPGQLLAILDALEREEIR